MLCGNLPRPQTAAAPYPRRTLGLPHRQTSTAITEPRRPPIVARARSRSSSACRGPTQQIPRRLPPAPPGLGDRPRQAEGAGNGRGCWARVRGQVQAVQGTAPRTRDGRGGEATCSRIPTAATLPLLSHPLPLPVPLPQRPPLPQPRPPPLLLPLPLPQPPPLLLPLPLPQPQPLPRTHLQPGGCSTHRLQEHTPGTHRRHQRSPSSI